MSAPLVNVTVKTRLLPDFTVSLPPQSSTGTGGAFDTLIAIAKPKVSVTVAGQPLQTWAPAGEPTTNYFPLVVAIGAIVAALAAFGLYTAIRGTL